ncbi:hypothetical protein QL285_073486 [Trifolium repens]|jgi:hypothetical protein|nr:hypothetical protein QL285_073486 [Trifolium repens]
MLLQTDKKEWNIEMMQLYLGPQTMSELDSTPLFASVVRDEPIWRPNKYGEYSVRSVNNFCLTELAAGAVPIVEGNWQALWNLRVPPKVRNLMWRLARNCVPTRARLIEKGINIIDQCRCRILDFGTSSILSKCSR